MQSQGKVNIVILILLQSQHWTGGVTKADCVYNVRCDDILLSEIISTYHTSCNASNMHSIIILIITIDAHMVVVEK